MGTPCANCLGKLTQGTVLILKDETSHDVEDWKVVAAIDGVEYYSEGENAVMAVRRVLSKVEGFDVEIGDRHGQASI